MEAAQAAAADADAATPPPEPVDVPAVGGAANEDDPAATEVAAPPAAAIAEGGDAAATGGVEPTPATGIRGVLTLHLKSAYNLVSADKNGKSDPFVEVTLPGEKPTRSRVIKESLSPVWDQKFQVAGKTPEELMALGPISLTVFDKDTVGADKLGTFTVPPEQLGSLPLGSAVKFSNKVLANAAHGAISFDLLFEANTA